MRLEKNIYTQVHYIQFINIHFIKKLNLKLKNTEYYYKNCLSIPTFIHYQTMNKNMS